MSEPKISALLQAKVDRRRREQQANREKTVSMPAKYKNPYKNYWPGEKEEYRSKDNSDCADK